MNRYKYILLFLIAAINGCSSAPAKQEEKYIVKNSTGLEEITKYKVFRQNKTIHGETISEFLSSFIKLLNQQHPDLILNLYITPEVANRKVPFNKSKTAHVFHEIPVSLFLSYFAKMNNLSITILDNTIMLQEKIIHNKENTPNPPTVGSEI